KLNIIFIGQFDNDTDKTQLQKFSNVNIVPPVSYEEALNFIINADALLLYGNANSTQVPGKAYEYFGSNAVIFTLLGDFEDELGPLMKKANKGPVFLNEEELIYKELIKLTDSFINNNLPLTWSEVQEDFQWINVGKDLESKLMKG
ncbi:hypothetical protein RB298_17125, partial [Priestia sp. BR_2]